MIRVLFVLLLVAAPSNLLAQSARLFVEADSVYVGERFELSLEVDAPADRVVAPDPARGDSVLGDLELLHRRVTGSAPVTLVYTATTFALDTARIAPMPVRLRSAAGDTTLLLTPMQSLPVRSVVEEEGAVLRGMLPLASFARPWWPWIAGLAALLAALWAFRYLRRRAPEELTTTVEPTRPPAEVAFGRLTALEQQEYPATAFEIKAFFVELSDLLRAYLEAATPLRAQELTSSELVDRARRTDLPDELPELLQRALSTADLAKFADYRPPREEAEAALSATREALERIETTRRAPLAVETD